jgi:tetrahydromethanopterin S-methyltransferase subunit F
MLWRSTSTKYLGVLLDNKLNWIDHINKTVEITNKRLELIGRPSGTSGGAHTTH